MKIETPDIATVVANIKTENETAVNANVKTESSNKVNDQKSEIVNHIVSLAIVKIEGSEKNYSFANGSNSSNCTFSLANMKTERSNCIATIANTNSSNQAVSIANVKTERCDNKAMIADTNNSYQAVSIANVKPVRSNNIATIANTNRSNQAVSLANIKTEGSCNIATIVTPNRLPVSSESLLKLKCGKIFYKTLSKTPDGYVISVTVGGEQFVGRSINYDYAKAFAAEAALAKLFNIKFNHSKGEWHTSYNCSIVVDIQSVYCICIEGQSLSGVLPGLCSRG